MAKKFQLTLSSWRNRRSRTQSCKKLPSHLLPKILFEYVARELQELGELFEQMPLEHKKLILHSYHFLIGKETSTLKPYQHRWPWRDPYFEFPDQTGQTYSDVYFYRSAQHAIKAMLKQLSLPQAISKTAQWAFKSIDWQTQFRMVQSIIAIDQQFGSLDHERGDLPVANDWLLERAMEPLVFAESLELSLAKKKQS